RSMNRPRTGRTTRRFFFLVTAALATAAVAAGVALARSGPAPIGTGIVVINTSLGLQSASAAGTGMVLTSSGEVLTNNHVIRGATSVKVVVPGTTHAYTARRVHRASRGLRRSRRRRRPEGGRRFALEDREHRRVGEAPGRPEGARRRQRERRRQAALRAWLDHRSSPVDRGERRLGRQRRP